MDVSGVRSSWLTMVRKSDLYWFSRLSLSFTSSTCRRWRSSSSLAADSCIVRSSTSDSRLPYSDDKLDAIASNWANSSSISREAYTGATLSGSADGPLGEPSDRSAREWRSSSSGRMMRRVSTT